MESVYVFHRRGSKDDITIRSEVGEGGTAVEYHYKPAVCTR